MAEWLKAHAWKACVRETVPWVRIPLSPPFLRHGAPLYPIVRIHRESAEDLRDAARFFAQGRSFSPWVRRRVFRYCTVVPAIRLFESTANQRAVPEARCGQL